MTAIEPSSGAFARSGGAGRAVPGYQEAAPVGRQMLVFYFIVTVLPAYFYLGGLFLSPLRVFLIVMIIR